MPIPGERPQKLGPWPRGAYNVGPENSVPPQHVRKALNVDFDDDGKPRLREGRTRVIVAAEPRCLWGNGRHMLFVVGEDLYFIDRNLDPRAIQTGIAPSAYLAYCDIEPYTFVSDGEANWRVDRDGNVRAWTLPTPDDPTPTLGTASGLDAGQYLLAITYTDETGEEGPSSGTVTITTSGEAINLSLPTAPAGVFRTRVYMTKPNGGQLLLAAAVPAAATSVSFSQQRLGRPLRDNEFEPMPPAHHACYYNGRLYVMHGAVLYWSQPNHYTATVPDQNFLPFGEDGTMIAAPSEGAQGLFVGLGSRTYFVFGADPSDTRLVDAYQAGVIPGSLRYVPGKNLALDNPPKAMVPMWIATNGVFCAGLPSGEVFAMSEQRFVTALSGRGAAGYRMHRGIHQFIATLLDPTENPVGFSDSVSTTIVRNGIEL